LLSTKLSDPQTGFKLKLKDEIIGYNGKPIYNNREIPKLQAKFPKLTPDELLEKCPTFTLGDQLASILMEVAGQEETKEATEKLKLFRWASKISSKQEIAKGELEIDLTQAADLFNYVSKAKLTHIMIQIPILALLDDIRENLTKSDLK